MRYCSVAKWPSEVCLGRKDNLSMDMHSSGDVGLNTAYSIIRLLEQNGFGGDGKIFPLKTYVINGFEEGEKVIINAPPEWLDRYSRLFEHVSDDSYLTVGIGINYLLPPVAAHDQNLYNLTFDEGEVTIKKA